MRDDEMVDGRILSHFTDHVIIHHLISSTIINQSYRDFELRRKLSLLHDNVISAGEMMR